jgi:adenylosuccinate synthase
MPRLQIGVGYLSDGQRLDSLPALASVQARATPVYESIEGWTASTAGARRVEDLPAAAIAYVRRLEELIEVPIVLLSTGPDRSETIEMGSGVI